MNLTIEQVHGPTSEVQELVGELNAALAALYAAHQRHGLEIEKLFEPHMRFFLARSDGGAVGCGGVALLDDYPEVKRMYTRPVARGRGVAKAVLARIEAEARASGVPILRLETGIYQPEAIGLYEQAGFRPCGPFGPYALMSADAIETSRFFEKPFAANRRA
jgi:putative acetyltransferase